MLDAIRHPALIFLVIAGLLWLGRRLLRAGGAWPAPPFRVATILLLAIYLGMQIVYLLRPGYWDPLEPSITVISQQLQHGRQIYHALDAAPRFSLLYGPAVYLANVFFLLLSNNPILGSKLSGVVCGAAALLIFCLVARRSFQGNIAFACVGGVTACALWFEHYTYWNRADSLLFFCSSLGLLGALSQREFIRWFVLSLAIGIAF